MGSCEPSAPVSGRNNSLRRKKTLPSLVPNVNVDKIDPVNLLKTGVAH